MTLDDLDMGFMPISGELEARYQKKKYVASDYPLRWILCMRYVSTSNLGFWNGQCF